MFFSFSLATYYTFSSLIRNRHKFLGLGPAHYILPAGCFGRRPPFKDHKRQPSSREFPLEDASSLLRLRPERRLFLDEIYNNFLDLTLLDQQELYVDCLQREFENCLHRGLSSRAIINDVESFRNLDTKDDPTASFIFEGNFGILLASSGVDSCDVEATQTTPKGPSNIIATQESLTTLRNDSLTLRRSLSRNCNTKVCIYTPTTPTNHSLVKAAYHQSLPAVVGACFNYPRSVGSAPSRYRFVVERKSLSTRVSLCRRVGKCTSFCSLPATFRVTKFSLATKRNCFSLIIFNVTQPAAVGGDQLNRQSLTVPGRRSIIFTCTRSNVWQYAPSRNNIYPLVNGTYHHSLPTAVDECIKHRYMIASAPARYRLVVHAEFPSTADSFCLRVGRCISRRSISTTVRLTKIYPATKRNCASFTSRKVDQRVRFTRGSVHHSLKDTGSATIERAVRFSLNNTGPTVCLNTPFKDKIPLANATFHQSLPVTTDSGCVKYPQIPLSAPATFFAVKRTSLTTTVSFCRRVGQYISYRSIPLTFKVTKISLAAKRNCVSVIIYKVNQSTAIKGGLHHEKKSIFFQQPLAITSLVRNANDGLLVDESIPSILASRVTQNVSMENSGPRLNSNPHANHGTFAASDTIQLRNSQKFHQGWLDGPNHIMPSLLTQDTPDATNSNKFNHRHVPVPDERLTAAENSPGTTHFSQYNQQLSVAMGFDKGVTNGIFMYEPNTGLSTSNVGAGVIGSDKFGQGNGAANFNDPFEWGTITNWVNGGFCQPSGSRHNGEALRNPLANVVNGAPNKPFSPWTRYNNNSRPGHQADPWASLWNTSHQSSERRNSGTRGHRLNRKQSSNRLPNNPTSNQATGTSIWDTNNFGWGANQGNSHCSSRGLMGTRTSNQAAKPSPFNVNNNFGWGATQQPARPGSMFWGAPVLIPKASSKAVPKASAKKTPKALPKRPSVHNKGSNKYNLPPSCPFIPWSDLENVLDRRTNKPKILGSGAYGIVKLMKQTSSGRLCAVKINQDDVDEQTVIENMQLEVDVLTTLRNLDCVPELFGVTKPEGKTPLPVIVQEFIGDPKTFRSTTLAIAIQAKVLRSPKATRVALRVCEAVRDIHSRKLLHCDLKVDNIMLEPGFVRKDDPNIKIIDFGASVKMDDKPKYQYNSREEMQWILEWSTHIAPEVARGEKPYNVSSEVYGLGMILKDLSFHFRGFLWRLGEECTDRDYRRRPSVEDVIQKIKTHLTSIQGAASRLTAPSSNQL